MRVEGSNGSVEILEDGIVVRRKGLANILTQGFQGDKHVPWSTITAVQFRPAGSLMAGLIQFTLVGGREFRGGMLEATKDENAVLFTKQQQSGFETVRDRVQSEISRSRKQSATAKGNPGDELAKLADLVERGFLTREEFETRKAAILR